MTSKKLHITHRFLDEAGDCTFYGKKRKSIIGTEGVSSCFIIGMVKFKEPLEPIRLKILEMQNAVALDPYFQVPSVIKKKTRGGYFFHAKDDLPEIKRLFFDYIKTINFSFEAVVARKTVERFTTKHKDKEEYFYADILSHLLKNKLQKEEGVVLNIAEKGTSTKNNNLTLAFEKAKERYANKLNKKTLDGEENIIKKRSDIIAKVSFNETNPITEPLLNVADYMCWTIQRIFEKGETRYYDFIAEKVSLVADIYDVENYVEGGNFYGPKNPLTAKNKISPQLH